MPPGAERGRALLMLLDGIWGSIGRTERVLDRVLEDCADDPQVRSEALGAKSFIASAVKVSGLAQATEWAEEARSLAVRPDDARLFGNALSWCRVHEGRPPDPPRDLPSGSG